MTKEIVFTEETKGDDFEKWIRWECRELRARGVSDVRKNWEAPAVPGKSHRKRETSAPDFGGCVRVDGRTIPVLFEAKAVGEEDRFKHANFNGDQLDDLKRRARLGGLAFVYVLAGDLQSMFVFRVAADGSITPGATNCKYNLFQNRTIRRERETWLDTVVRLGWVDSLR